MKSWSWVIIDVVVMYLIHERGGSLGRQTC